MNDELADRLEQLAGRFERMRLDDYVRFLSDGRRLMKINFLAGIARGVGTAVGFTLLGAVLIVVLQHIVEKNIPVIGDFLAEVVSVVRNRMK